jgi:hypothetical protein
MRLLAALALHGVLASTGPEPRPVQRPRAATFLDWSAVEGCPSSSEIQRRTEHFLGARISAYTRSIHAEGRVEAIVGGHELILAIVIDGARERHSLRAIDCERLGTDAALLIASALDPFARGPSGDVELDARMLARPFDRPPPIQRPRSQPQTPIAARPSPPVVPEAVAPETPAPEAPAPLASMPERDPGEDVPKPRSPRDLRGFLGGAGLGFAGVFPSPSGGVALEGGLERGRFRWQLGAQGWFGGQFRADTLDGSELGANLTAWTGSTAACFVPRVGTVAFPLCATLGAGAMVASAVGTPVPTTSVQPWAFAGADLRVNWTPRPAVGVYVGLAVLPALARASWAVTNPDASFRVPAVSGLVRLGLEWRRGGRA